MKINVTNQLREKMLRDLEQSNINISKQSMKELVENILKQQKRYKLETFKEANKKTMNLEFIQNYMKFTTNIFHKNKILTFVNICCFIKHCLRIVIEINVYYFFLFFSIFHSI